VPPQKLQDWFIPSDLLEVPGEVTLDGDQELEDVLAAILACIGPVLGRRGEIDGGLFLWLTSDALPSRGNQTMPAVRQVLPRP
jgi:hypothetical protein